MDKIMSKQFNAIAEVTLSEFYNQHIDNDKNMADVKKTLKDKIDAFQNNLKENVNINKSKKSLETKRKPNKYNRFMKEKMLELKVTEPKLTSKERFSKVAGMWKDEKETWEDTLEEN
jgi:hypothetical protein